MREGVIVEEAFAESSRPAMIQRVLRCLNIEPAEAYFEAQKPTPVQYMGSLGLRDDDEGEPYTIPGCANGACGVD